MSWLTDLHLISLFSFYLTGLFVVSVALRWRQYHAFAALAGRFPSRWPKLLELARQHAHLFLTWQTVKPLALVLGLLFANLIATYGLFPEAREYKVADLLAAWPALPFVVVPGLLMLACDAYATWSVGELDRGETERYFDQAEYWLRSWKAPVVRFFTFGHVNPRQMVAQEVRTALESASAQINSSLYWVSVQTGLRVVFGLALWGSWAVNGWLRELV